MSGESITFFKSVQTWLRTKNMLKSLSSPELCLELKVLDSSEPLNFSYSIDGIIILCKLLVKTFPCILLNDFNIFNSFKTTEH